MKHFAKRYLFLLMFQTIAMVICLGTTKPGWAQEHPIVLATMNWEPFCGESLPNGGVFTALTRRC